MIMCPVVLRQTVSSGEREAASDDVSAVWRPGCSGRYHGCQPADTGPFHPGSFQSHDPSQRSQGFLTLAGGLVVTFAKEILDLITGGGTP